jgi:hypothetical protein
MHRGAVLAFPDDQGEPQARLVLERVKWLPEHTKQYFVGGPPRTAAWLMCNPSRASHEIDDPTAGRVVHHSGRAGCPRSLVGNVWPYRTPYPADLWAAIAAGLVTPEMQAANLDALAMISAQADIRIVAFGVAPRAKHPVAVARAACSPRRRHNGHSHFRYLPEAKPRSERELDAASPHVQHCTCE